MKRTIILNFLIAVLLIFAGFAVSHNDMRNYHNLMDRGNIQENALIYPTKSHQSIPGVLRKFEKANLKKYQIYFIQKKNPDLSYVYMSHAQTKLPMTNGRFFSASDFQSPISFAVLGRDVAKTVYKPQYQAYYQLNDNYYSVLGVTGLKSTKKLNRHIFISTSPQQSNKTQLRHYQVVVDGPILRHSQQLKTMQKLIRARTPYRSANQINNVTQGWWTRWGGTFLILGAIAILVVILSSFVQIPTLRLLHNLNVQGDFLFDFQFGKWLQFIVTEAVVFGIALVLISVKIQIISWKYLFIYFLLLYIVVILLSALSTLLRHKNEATDEY